MNYKLLILFWVFTRLGLGQETVYFFPGQGSDERLFTEFKLDKRFIKVVISYPVPSKEDDMRSFALRLIKQIDQSKPYSFVGVSMGGMLISELMDTLSPRTAIIISSAKCSSELPSRYRFQRVFPLNKIVPKRMIKGGARMLQPLVEPDRKQHKETFKAMLKSKTPEYYKRTVNLIVNWEKKDYSDKLIHIHGDGDHTLPIDKVCEDIVIPKGSHMMALTQGPFLNRLVLSIIEMD